MYVNRLFKDDLLLLLMLLPCQQSGFCDAQEVHACSVKGVDGYSQFFSVYLIDIATMRGNSRSLHSPNSYNVCMINGG